MVSSIKISISVAVIALTATGSLAQQTSTNQVAAETAWSVFEEKDPRECWAVSAPVETVNTKDGKVVTVNRGDILLMTFYRPGAGVNGQVTFTGGYPFAKGSSVNVDVDGNKFEMFTEGEWAWPASDGDDAKIISAMKRGAEATLAARSGKGTVTKDKFSLLGFTAAVEGAEKRCR